MLIPIVTKEILKNFGVVNEDHVDFLVVLGKISLIIIVITMLVEIIVFRI